MANETMTLISTITVGAGGAASIDFTSIPQTYTDLQIVLSARNSNTDGYTGLVTMRFNGTSANYGFRQLYANGAGVGSGNGSGGTRWNIGEAPGASLTANTFGSNNIYIPNYTGSTNKSISVDNVSENNSSTAYQWQMFQLAGLWSNTAAITQITLYSGELGATNFLQYTTASLYGILKGSGGATVS